jgi:hypothetical protein
MRQFVHFFQAILATEGIVQSLRDSEFGLTKGWFVNVIVGRTDAAIQDKAIWTSPVPRRPVNYVPLLFRIQ